MEIDLLITDITIIDEKEYIASVGIHEGEIVFIGNIHDLNIKAKRILNGKGLELLPGGIDAHCHLGLDLRLGRDKVSCDDVKSGTFSAINGGITTVITYAYREVDKSLQESYLSFKSKAKDAYTELFYHIGIMEIDNRLEKEIRELDGNDIVSVKLHLNDPVVNDSVLYRILRSVNNKNLPLCVHCEQGELIEFLKKEALQIGIKTVQAHPMTRPAELEELAIYRAGILAGIIDANLHIVHLSSFLGLKAVQELQKRGISITAETTLQYLLLTDEEYNKDTGYLYSCSPPFRKEKDITALWHGLRDESISFIVTDHAPFTKAQKDAGKTDFTKLLYGIPGVENLYPIIYTEAIKRGFSKTDVAKFISTNPAKRFGLYPRKGTIAVGSDADLVIFDPVKEVKITANIMHTNCDFTPYNGYICKGYPILTIVKGTIHELF